jgi:hypothetical protein
VKPFNRNPEGRLTPNQRRPTKQPRNAVVTNLSSDVRGISAGFDFCLRCYEHSDLGSIATFLTAPIALSRVVAFAMAFASSANETSILDLPPAPPRARKILSEGTHREDYRGASFDR